jgi:hypothetical protein
MIKETLMNSMNMMKQVQRNEAIYSRNQFISASLSKNPKNY